MACSGGHCSYHNTGTSTCSGHRGVCTSNRGVTLSSGVTSGGKVLSTHISNLRNNIAAELARYRSHPYYNPGTPSSSFGVGARITNAASASINNEINDLSPKNDTPVIYTPAPSGVSPWDNRPRTADDPSAGGTSGARTWNKYGQKLVRSHVQELLTYYNTIRADCICNSDCNCNAVCNCHNNCGCHY
ncbi:hypothetical protein M902_1763 [Bacteriovorax sp. BAL6_X]|uniref:hypothetical protein n=1 Tax=Bacteriovorax sp. BAL6_X TaxID=1201290 RepID=UPI000385A3AE|nr:hypothetical protein [Bacteriovorax sp. BAL6_X]EPZ52288.1 hypothetical protein M902_1763 [Bacteriovorax sp. BAL6_X]